MRMLSAILLFTCALVFGASLMNQPVTNGVSSGDFHQPSIMVEQLTTNAKDLPVQSFDAY
jgi:hypothetical protein